MQAQDLRLFQAALGLSEPWQVVSVEFDPVGKRLDLRIDFEKGARFACPECGREGCPVHDTEHRRSIKSAEDASERARDAARDLPVADRLGMMLHDVAAGAPDINLEVRSASGHCENHRTVHLRRGIVRRCGDS